MKVSRLREDLSFFNEKLCNTDKGVINLIRPSLHPLLRRRYWFLHREIRGQIDLHPQPILDLSANAADSLAAEHQMHQELHREH